MFHLRLAALVILTRTAFAGCLALVAPPTGSECVQRSAEVQWTNRPGLIQLAPVMPQPQEQFLADPAFVNALKVEGPQTFQLNLTGPHLIEVIAWIPDDGKDSFILRQGGEAIDKPFQQLAGGARMRPKTQMRSVSLVGRAQGGRDLEIQTESPEFYIAALRWTPQQDFESRIVPQLLERGRHWNQAVLFSASSSSPAGTRQHRIREIALRLVWSDKPEIRNEALINYSRAMYWLAAENHEPRDVALLDLLFQHSLRATPADLALRQMVSASCAATSAPGKLMPKGAYCNQVQPVPWKIDIAPFPQGAPEWAVEQQVLKARMDAITRWWVDKRQQPNGELGGGWGDDVEMIRHWAPLAMGLGSTIADRGIRRLADGLWASGLLRDGYDSRISDVEHSSEPTTDTQPIVAAMRAADSTMVARLKDIAACSPNWIGKQADGQWRFHSSWFNCKEQDRSAARSVDTHMNVRAMGPALWYAYLTRDKQTIDLLANWAQSWAIAMRATAHGKPAGLIPSVLNASDGSYLINGSPAWDKPNAEWDYFQWSGASQEQIASLFLAVHDLTADRKWLDAAGESFKIFDNCLAVSQLCEQMRKHPEAFYEWRRRSGDARYDLAFGYKPDLEPAEKLALMAKQAREMSAALSVNFDIFTSEALYTDRVYYRLPPEYRQSLFGGESPRGDRSPTFAVTWAAEDTRFARAVVHSSPAALTLRVYSFEPRPAPATVMVWRLAPGIYDLKVGDAPNQRITITKQPQAVPLQLPPGKEIDIIFSKPSS